jgi:2-polyprenyl-6-methoxyphenol hydroxylase-like FAD-dependent oxidoreductase
MDADVVIAGAGPTGLMLAAELRLAGVRPLVLERRERIGDTPRARGLNGRILDLLRYRGLTDRLAAAGRGPVASPAIPFGGLELDLRGLTDSPLRALHLPQPRLERLLAERAGELGAEVRRGHQVVALRQDEAAVTAEVAGPDGPYRVTARYLVGCDGAHSQVRAAAGIPFPGTTCPEVNRLGQVAVPEAVKLLDDGGLDVPGLGRLTPGFTRTDRGVFAYGVLAGGELLVQTTVDEAVGPEEEAAEAAAGEPSGIAGPGSRTADREPPMDLPELRASIRRVLGADLPLERASRLSRYRFQARQAARYRAGRVLLAGDAAHQFPATGSGLNIGMLDAVNLAWKLAAAVQGWAPDGLLDTYHGERHAAGARAMLQAQAQAALRRGHDTAAEALRQVFRELCEDEQPLRRIAALVGGTDIRYPLPGGPHGHPLTGAFAPDLALRTEQGAADLGQLLHGARPVLLDLADRPDLREAAGGWRHRVDLRTAGTDARPADALLIRPDAHVAWAVAVGEPPATAVPALRDALTRWFGAPA